MTRRLSILAGLALSLGAIAAGALMFSAVEDYREPGIRVTVTNAGARPLSDVRVSLGGKELPLGDIPAGASASGRIVPEADSTIALSVADPAGKIQTVWVDTYVSGGYRGRVEFIFQDGQITRSEVDLW